MYNPARPRHGVNVVLEQYPRRGLLASYDSVTLVQPKPEHGVVPNVVGLSLDRARERLRRRELEPQVDSADDDGQARVVRQKPPPGVAAVPGLGVKLVVAAG